MITLIVDNKEFFGILVSILTVLIPLATFLVSKNKEQKLKNFENFHQFLIRGLANLDNKTGLDQQVAIIYELRQYPRYKPVVIRLLRAQLKRWKSELEVKPHFQQLIEEAELTINYLKKNFLQRVLTQD